MRRDVTAVYWENLTHAMKVTNQVDESPPQLWMAQEAFHLKVTGDIERTVELLTAAVGSMPGVDMILRETSYTYGFAPEMDVA